MSILQVDNVQPAFGSNTKIADADGNSDWQAGHLVMGAFHLWVDANGDLRIKNGAPTSDEDGDIVGLQMS